MSAEQVDRVDQVAEVARIFDVPPELVEPRPAARYVPRHSRPGQPERVAPALVGFAVCLLLAVVAGVAFVALI